MAERLRGRTRAARACETRVVTEPSPRPSPLAAVLAGGAGRRLGGAKPTTELAGEPLIAYPLRALAQAGLTPVVAAKAGTPLPDLDARIVIEPDEPRHPLAGVAEALRQSGRRGALVVPCDAPFRTSMLLRVLASAAKTTAVRSAGRPHPLIAFYAPEHLGRIAEAAMGSEPATQTLDDLGPEWIEAPERETFNVNTPADLARAEDMLKEPRS